MQGTVKGALGRAREGAAARARELEEEALAQQERLDAARHTGAERTEDAAVLQEQARPALVSTCMHISPACGALRARRARRCAAGARCACRRGSKHRRLPAGCLGISTGDSHWHAHGPASLSDVPHSLQATKRLQACTPLMVS